MKKIFILIICFLISFSVIYSKEGENKMSKDNSKFEIQVNDISFTIPNTLKKFLNDGWNITDKKPYFLNPLVGEDYYDIRTDWSLSKDGKSIIKGGSIIRLLEKNGILLEVTIKNPDIPEESENYKKIEEGIVNSIIVFYDKSHSNIKLNNKEVSSLSQENLIKDYPQSDGWIHVPTNYRNHPEFNVSTEYTIVKSVNDFEKNITVYFDLEDKPFKISISDETFF
ncbi:hypothetical protein [Fusobacterium sp.]|uniref:hypothetical protein n=1 Tax=Fusobacterium sp. TaxID=68766 RepID=UPI0026044BB9|nr:hypothetical protein [Fusobacterium sp.]